MYCLHCGREISDLAVNCPYCGTAQVEDASPELSGTAPVRETPVSLRSLTKRTWAKILLAAAMFCFFLPFVAVSCSSEKSGKAFYTRNISGFEMMKLGSDGLDLEKEEEDEYPAVRAFAEHLPMALSIAAFGMGAVALALLLLGRSARAAGRLSVGSAVMLLLLALLFFLFYSPLSPVTEMYSEERKKMLEYFSVRLRPGIFLSAGCFIAGAVFCRKDRPPEEYY